MRARVPGRRGRLLLPLVVGVLYVGGAIGVGLVVAAVHGPAPAPRAGAALKGDGPATPSDVLVCHVLPGGGIQELRTGRGSALEASHRAHGDWILRGAGAVPGACRGGPEEVVPRPESPPPPDQASSVVPPPPTPGAPAAAPEEERGVREKGGDGSEGKKSEGKKKGEKKAKERHRDRDGKDPDREGKGEKKGKKEKERDRRGQNDRAASGDSQRTFDPNLLVAVEWGHHRG